MTKERTDDEARTKTWELIKDNRFCLMVTHDASSKMHARPMAAMDDKFEGELWFFTKDSSPKTDEITDDSEILLCYSKPNSQSYVSVNGRATVVNDRAKIEQLWKEPARLWFPDGADDPSIRLIHVKVESAEYWDAPASGFVYLYGYTIARLTGETPTIGENQKVEFKTAS